MNIDYFPGMVIMCGISNSSGSWESREKRWLTRTSYINLNRHDTNAGSSFHGLETLLARLNLYDVTGLSPYVVGTDYGKSECSCTLYHKM